VAPQAITRAVKELELFYGEPLFYRNTRQIRITDFGEQLASRARDAVGSMDALFAGSASPAADLGGTVRITAPTVIGRRFLLPVLNGVARDYPQVSLDLRLSDTISDVVEQQIDIGIRVGFLRDSSLVARAVGKIAFLAVGTPELIERVGRPDSVQALLDLPTVALIDTSAGRRWPWYFAGGQQFVPRAASFVTDDPEAEFNLVLDGIGFGQIADCLVMPYIHEGRLVQVLPEHTPPPWDLYIYRPQRRPLPARIRIVYDRLVEAFSDPGLLPSGPD
jgi:DNA-binding transcriptional LysR family regulator